jgi:dihydrofolate reductase
VCNVSTKLYLSSDQAEDTFLVTSLDSAVELLRSQGAEKRLYRTFLIGGAQLWDEAVQKQQKGSGSSKWILDTLLITRIHEPAFEECDVFLPEFRTDEQARQDNDEPVAGLEETTSKGYIRSSPQDLDDFIGEAVEHGVVEEKDTRYSLQMWKKV